MVACVRREVFLSLSRFPPTISYCDESSPYSPLKLARTRLTIFHSCWLEASRWLRRLIRLFSRSVIESSRLFASLTAVASAVELRGPNVNSSSICDQELRTLLAWGRRSVTNCFFVILFYFLCVVRIFRGCPRNRLSILQGEQPVNTQTCNATIVTDSKMNSQGNACSYRMTTWSYMETIWSYMETIWSYMETTCSYMETTCSYMETTWSYMETIWSYMETTCSYM